MPELNSRVDSFITLLLDVTGRARPEDLDAHTPSGADELLRMYAQAHGDRPLSFDGDSLLVVAATMPSEEPEVQEPVPAHEQTFETAATEPEAFVLDAAMIPEVGAEPEPGTGETPPQPVFDPSTLPDVVLAPTMASEAGGGAEPSSLDSVIPEVTLEASPAAMPAYVPVAAAEPSVMTPVASADGPVKPLGVIPDAGDSSFFEFGPAEDVAPAYSEPTQGDIPDLPEIPETPSIPDLPEIPEAPVVPDLPEIPETPRIPDLPEIPEAPVVPDLPEIEWPTAPEPEPSPVNDLSDVSAEDAGPELVLIPMPAEEDAGGFIDLDAALGQQVVAPDDFALPDLPVIEPTAPTGSNPFELPADLDDPEGF